MPANSYKYFRIDCKDLKFPAKFMFFNHHSVVDIYVDYNIKPTTLKYAA